MLGWTQTELARRARLGTAYVNQLLNGDKGNPSLEVLDKLAAALGIATAVLIDGRLTQTELRTELAKAALREASRRGLPHHPKFERLLGTDLAPTTTEGWQQLHRVLEVVESRRRDDALTRRRRVRGARR